MCEEPADGEELEEGTGGEGGREGQPRALDFATAVRRSTGGRYLDGVVE